ncbi:hypothetical protein BT63DRAFT_192936 [Microthyrium microscopicum]|uniref:Nuclear RNA binding protein n=1 Tax=Microthyrium microscopicum TaxID=703497 RepID=A0A6A6UJ87_9PEZI|nr:hypothetical protein BT63DRAFT_192936 [Microthyrium microscopicum]
MDRKENEKPLPREAAHSPMNRLNKPLPMVLDEDLDRTPRAINNARDVNFSHTKRHKRYESVSENGQRTPSAKGPNETSEGRASRFREETMRDRPSEKPPSMFMRFLPGAHRPNPSVDKVDNLMERYHEDQTQRPPLMHTSRTASRATQFTGLTHHANTSISSDATMAFSEQSASTTRSRKSGFFQMVNPVNLWQKIATGKNDSKVTLPEYDDDELVQRQIKAEQAYATLKKNGKLGSLGSRHPSMGSKVFSKGYNHPEPEVPNQRDSGIDMTEDLRPSMEDPMDYEPAPAPTLGRRVSAVPGNINSKKKFHLRTPSLIDLKRIASESNLIRSPSKHLLIPETKPLPATPGSATREDRPFTSAGQDNLLRSSKSKKDLARQAKLSKKVGDLEAKLQRTRSKLNEIAAAERPATAYEPEQRPKTRGHLRPRGFEPMPTLPSESLLMTEAELNESIAASAASQPMPDLSKSPFRDLAALQPEMPSARTILAPEPATPGSRAAPPPSPVTEVKGPVISAFEFSSTDNSPEGAIRKVLKKHKKLVRSSSKPEMGENSVKKSPSKKSSPRRVRPKANPHLSPGKLRASASSPVLGPLEVIPNEMVSNSRSSLDTVLEENLLARSFEMAKSKSPFQSSIPTPTKDRNRLHRHTRSMSPVKNDLPTASRGKENTPTRSHRRARSTSPPPSINFSRPNLRQDSSPLVVRPDRVDVPHLPSRAVNGTNTPRLAPNREAWEWPEDVF